MSSSNQIIIDHANLPITGIERSTTPYGSFIEVNKTGGDDELSSVQVQDMFLPDFSMRISKGELSKEAVFINTSAQGLDQIGTCLVLKGNITTSVQASNKTITSFNGSQNFKYDPNNIFIHKSPANTPFHIAHFSVKPEYLFQYLPENEWWSDELKTKIASGDSIIGDRFTPITLLQERALQTVFDCPLGGKLGQLMIETSIMQILLIQLHSVFNSNEIFTASLARRDVDLIQGVKEYLSNTFLEDHSLEHLARHFGVNTNKLMSLFRKVFDKSIFEYLSELRMEHARELLLEKDYQVIEVSRTLGYKNPNHFSTAFKRRFGFPPSQLR